MPSFDTVLDPNLVEVRNAVDQTAKEIGTRFDFKGTSAAIEFKEKEKEKDEQAPEKEAAETSDTAPLLDLSDAAVKKLIRAAKKRGYVTHDQINSVLPSEEVNSEQIEDVLAMFSEMGVNVVETEEASDDEEKEREEADEEAEGGAEQRGRCEVHGVTVRRGCDSPGRGRHPP